MNSEIWGIRLSQKSSTAIYKKSTPPTNTKQKTNTKNPLYIRVKNKKKKIKEKQEKMKTEKPVNDLYFKDQITFSYRIL